MSHRHYDVAAHCCPPDNPSRPNGRQLHSHTFTGPIKEIINSETQSPSLLCSLGVVRKHSGYGRQHGMRLLVQRVVSQGTAGAYKRELEGHRAVEDLKTVAKLGGLTRSLPFGVSITEHDKVIGFHSTEVVPPLIFVMMEKPILANPL